MDKSAIAFRRPARVQDRWRPADGVRAIAVLSVTVGVATLLCLGRSGGRWTFKSPTAADETVDRARPWSAVRPNAIRALATSEGPTAGQRNGTSQTVENDRLPGPKTVLPSTTVPVDGFAANGRVGRYSGHGQAESVAAGERSVENGSPRAADERYAPPMTCRPQNAPNLSPQGREIILNVKQPCTFHAILR